ncbi:MAG: septum formation initiator family protein [Candidatus Babeliales bacterium]
MILIKRLLLQFLLLTEICLFVYVYLYGSNGFYALQELSHENEQLEQNIEELTQQIVQLEDEISEWGMNDFYKEKVAREQLQMSHKNDEIYYIA